MKNKIIFLIPYFGKLKGFFNYWAYSASKSNLCDFYLFTDNEYHSPYKNIIVINMNLKEFSNLVKEKINTNYEISSGYKTSEYRPAFGLIFEEYVKNYAYWGYCDLDTILGDIDSYIQPILGKYDRYFKRSHFTFFKNNHENNIRFLEKPLDHEFVYFYDALAVNKNVFFDEEAGLSKIWRKNKYSLYEDDVLEDIDYYYFNFKTTCGYFVNNKKIYEYDNGKLFVITKKCNILVKNEVMYIHLQKRNILIKTNSLTRYYIVPNEFIDADGANLQDVYVNFTKFRPIMELKRLLKYKFKIMNILKIKK